MKILFTADLHLDHWLVAGRDPLASVPREVWQQFDALVIAGDLSNKPKIRWPKMLAHIGDYIPLDRVYLTPGNHDYYDFKLDGDDRLAEIATQAGARFVQKSVLELGGCRLLCATLWTDFELADAKEETVAWLMADAQKMMNDYRYIRMSNDGYRRITPQDTRRVHKTHRRWLEEQLSQPFDGDTIVVSHHAPHPDGLDPPNSTLDGAYTSDLSDMIEIHAPKLWIYGHTHTPASFTVGSTEIRNVSLGYPGQVRASDTAHRILRGIVEIEGGKVISLGQTDPDLAKGL